MWSEEVEEGEWAMMLGRRIARLGADGGEHSGCAEVCLTIDNMVLHTHVWPQEGTRNNDFVNGMCGISHCT